MYFSSSHLTLLIRFKAIFIYFSKKFVFEKRSLWKKKQKIQSYPPSPQKSSLFWSGHSKRESGLSWAIKNEYASLLLSIVLTILSI